MSKRSCVLCSETKSVLFSLPKEELLRKKWLLFIFQTTPKEYKPNVLLCARHFTEDCFISLGAFTAGYIKRLSLKDVAIPTLFGPVSSTESQPLSVRCRSKPQRQVCKTVLQHFDAQYSEELGEQWISARGVLLNPHSWQYGVLLNRFSDLTNLEQGLRALGYTSLLPRVQPESQSHTAHIPLQCLIHRDPVRLPNQGHQPGWLKQYFLLNAASVLPVLALDVRDGENVLDLCAAPGGKSLAILQTATPRLLHCNEVDTHRHDWLLKTLESYVPTTLQHLLSLTRLDGRSVGDERPGAYDKVLVDAPCSNDRSWLYTPDTHQGDIWLKERAQLPLLQKQLLCSALAAVRPGGVVVYSTCTMSQAENQSVMEAVLASYQGMELLDLTQLIDSLSDHFGFAHLHPPLGHLVIPKKGQTWGPMYVCRLKRVY